MNHTTTQCFLFPDIFPKAARTDCARAPVGMLRERLLKLGAWVARSLRRVVLHLPTSFPFLDTFYHLALALGARAG